MIHQRNTGIYIGVLAVLLFVNALSLLCFLLIEIEYGIYGFEISDRLAIYLLALPGSLYVCRERLHRLLSGTARQAIIPVITTSLRLAVFETLIFFGIYFFLKDVGISRQFLLLSAGISFVLNCVLLRYVPRLLRVLLLRGQNNLKAVVYGHGQLPNGLRDYLKSVNEKGIRLLGYYADDALPLDGLEWMGRSSEFLLCEGGRKRVRAEVVFAFSEDLGDPTFRANLDLAMERGARVHIYSWLTEYFLDPVQVEADGKEQFISFLDEPLQNPVNQFNKRLFDVIFSLPVIVLLLPPLMLLVWTVQRFQSPGPLLFKQTRYGRHREPFTILKFRSMHVSDPTQEGRQATKGDPRIYSFGTFLRKSSLDEFPQFWNVLLGQMSVVGPRPHMTLHDRQFEGQVRRYRSRHYVKPGITGLAQVTGYRGEAKDPAAISGRVRCDIEYLTQWSLLQDVLIVLKTSWQVVFPPKSAY